MASSFAVVAQDSRTKARAPAFLVEAGPPSILHVVTSAVSPLEERASVGWLDRFPGRRRASDPQALIRVAPGDQIEAGGLGWTVTAVLVYRDASSEWPVVKIERGAEAAWIALEDGQIVRYDHLDLPVGGDGRAIWNGRSYARAEMGNATVSRVAGTVDVAVGDTLSYQVLRSDADPHAWISVEAWPSGFVEVSVGRLWPVDRIVTRQESSR
jgi:hypothetical protein